jgi:ribosome-associated translation inhibitor RaiA
MQLPLQVTFRNVEPSDSVRSDIEAHAAKLHQFFDRIVSCRVAVEATTRRGQKGKLFNVRVDLGVPGREIVTSGRGFKSQAHEDVRMAVKNAFTVAGRTLEDYARKLRGNVKTPAAPPKALRVRRQPTAEEAE